ncbi:Metabotropic GABA-B receptor subtype 2, isoform C [Mortierella sp. AM989]|nr:Metabotropic GABA-B receptor subtype 2, isoform C [Mortierella sp. AM989]
MWITGFSIRNQCIALIVYILSVQICTALNPFLPHTSQPSPKAFPKVEALKVRASSDNLPWHTQGLSSAARQTPTRTAVASSASTPLILPQNQVNVSMRVFPYTPSTGANNSLYLTPNVTSYEGLVEIKVGLLLPYSLPNNLTQQLAYSGTSAIRMAVSEINENHLIPGAYITLVLKDSFNGMDPENSGAAQAIFSTVSLLQTDGGVSGVIGDVSSALTVQSALLTSRLSIPQCSYSAGSTQLSSKEDYGHFFRTIPTELMFGRVMMDFVANRGWKSIAVFYTGDALGSEMMDNIVLQAKRRNIAIGYRKAFWEMGTSSDVEPGLDGLKDSGQQIVLVAAVGVPQVRLIIEAVRRGFVSKNYVWLTINQVTEPLLGMEESALKPMDLNGLLMFDNMLRLHGYPPYEDFLNRWAALDPVDYPYAGEREISSNEAQAYSCMMVMANGFANAAKGNWTALHLLALGKLGSKLKPTDMNTNYTGPGGPMVFDENGDVVYGNFIVYNFQNGRVVEIGHSYSGVLNLSSPPIYYDGTRNTPPDTAPLRVLNPAFGSPIGIVIICVAGMGVAFSLVTMIIVVLHRNAHIIKASSPLFCCLELCGFMLLYFSVMMGLDIPNRFLCIARPLTLNVGFILVVSNIVAKNFRVYRIFHNIYVTKRVIRDSHLLKIVGVIMTVNLAIMVIWFATTPPTLEQVIMEDLTTYWDCSSQAGESTPFFALLFIYNVVLLLLATYLAYKNRNVAANYNECRQIAFVVYNILLSGCIAMPTVFLPQDQFLTKFFLSNVVLLFGTTVSLMFMFLPKLMKLFSQIERSLHGNRAEGTDEGSFDGLFNRRSWFNTGSTSGGGGGSTVDGHVPGGRKGSVGSIEDSKGNTLRESHMGFMGVKFQNRYMPFLANWCMRRVVLFPMDKYFTAFESGKPEAGRTFTYKAVYIHSKEPDSYILRVTGHGRFDFLFQVKDEERLMYWYSLFECKQGNTFTSATGGNAPDFSFGNLPTSLSQAHSESDQTLRVSYLNREYGGKSARTKKASGDDGYYFSRATHGSSLHGLGNPNQHQNCHHAASSYTIVPFTASPRESMNAIERPHTIMEPPSRQTTLGPLDIDPSNLLDGERHSSSPRHIRQAQTPDDYEMESELEERQLHFGGDNLSIGRSGSGSSAD